MLGIFNTIVPIGTIVNGTEGTLAAISAGDYRAAGKTGIQTLLIAVATAITLGEGAAALAGGKGAGTAAIGNAESQAVKEAAKDSALAQGGAVPRVNGRIPINSKYAGQAHPSGIKFNEKGLPDFLPHAKGSDPPPFLWTLFLSAVALSL